MKIATTTSHCAYNYGAILQAYSLLVTLRKMGHDACVLDYWPSCRLVESASILKRKKVLKPVTLLQNSLTLFHSSAIRKKMRRFDEFRDKLLPRTTRRYLGIDDLLSNPPKIDAYITGSDQVWNPIGAGIDPIYFLSFAKELGARSIAYAPSIGLPFVPEKYKEEMAIKINNIDHLSSRERRGTEIIKELTGRFAETVVDPVFLQNCEEWSYLVGHPRKDGGYILVYAVRRREYMENMIRFLKKKMGMPVVLIVGANAAVRGFMPADHVVWDAGPKEFVSLFLNANCICTNSFHGTAFSIIFNKPFLAFPHTNGDSRITNILERTGQQNRAIYPGDCVGDILSIDAVGRDRLNSEIKFSMKYLQVSLA